MKVLTGDEKLTELKYPKFFQSLKILVWRNFISVKRNPFITNAKIIQPLYFSALLCLTFHNLGKDNRGIEDRHGAILYFMNGIGFTPILILSIMIAYEKQLVSKEIREKLYSPLSYYLSIFLVEVPLAVISTLVVVSIIYFIVGFNQESADKFFIFYTISVCFLLSCLSAGALSGSLGQSSRDVLIISPLITVIFVLFSGIIVDIDSTPMVFRYIRYFLPLYYCHSGLIRNEFQGLDLNDDVNPEPDERFDYGSDISTSAFGLIGLAIGFWLAAVIISYATLVKR
jgi:ATP-binding cassette subfamily G (WHITE) protein 2